MLLMLYNHNKMKHVQGFPFLKTQSFHCQSKEKQK